MHAPWFTHIKTCGQCVFWPGANRQSDYTAQNKVQDWTVSKGLKNIFIMSKINRFKSFKFKRCKQ